MIHMFLIYLHLFHQIVLQETFDVLQVSFLPQKNRTFSSNGNKHAVPKTSRAIYSTNNESSRDSEYRLIINSISKTQSEW